MDVVIWACHIHFWNLQASCNDAMYSVSWEHISPHPIGGSNEPWISFIMSARRAVPLPNVTGHNFLTLSSAAHSKREPQSRPSQSVLYPASLLFFSFSLISQVGTVAVLPHSNCVVNCDLQVWLLGGLLFCAVIKSKLRLRFRKISTLYSPKSTPRPDRLTVFS